MCASKFCRAFQILLAGTRPGKTDVVGNAVVKQHRLFKHHTNLLAQFAQAQFAYIYSV